MLYADDRSESESDERTKGSIPVQHARRSLCTCTFISYTHVETNEETKGQRLSCHQRGAYCYRASYCPISVLLSNASCFCLFFLGFSSCPPSLPPFLPSLGEDQTRGRGSYHHGLVVHVMNFFFPQASAKSNLVKVIYAYLLYCCCLLRNAAVIPMYQPAPT